MHFLCYINILLIKHTNVNSTSLYLKKAGLASRNIVYLLKFHLCFIGLCFYIFIFISLITRMRYKRDIKMGRLYTPGGAVIGIVGGGVTFRFF